MNRTIRLLIYSAAGVIAGIINGLLGTGGGIILIYTLTLMKADPKDAFANTVAAILPMSAVSAVGYIQRGILPLEKILIYIIPAVCGGLLGAYLLDKLKIQWIKKAFALLVIYAGVRFII